MEHFLSGQGSTLLCDLCKEALRSLQSFILSHEDALEEEIIELFCEHLPPDPATAVSNAQSN